MAEEKSENKEEKKTEEKKQEDTLEAKTENSQFEETQEQESKESSEGEQPEKHEESKETKEEASESDEPNEETSEEVKEKAKEESDDSSQKSKELEEKRKQLLEKAKKFQEEKVDSTAQVEELKKEVKGKKEEMLVPLEEYVKAGIYLGTRVVTPDMRPFVYRRRADGLAIFNTDLIDEKLKEAAEYLARFDPEDVIVVCKREAGWRAVEKFAELTGIRAFTKKYPAGILTNTSLPNFFENELTIVSDAWVDKNALKDTLKVNKNVLMICDTNNFSKGASQIILGNNKSPRSLGLIYYLLTREYLKARGEDTSRVPDLEWWTGELQTEATEKEAKQKSKMRGAKYGV